MLKPLDKESAFAAIAEDLELPLVLLSNPDSRVRLAMVEKIGAALMSTNLTFRDLAERVTAPRPPAVQPLVPPPTAAWPMSEITVDPGTEMSREDVIEKHVATAAPARRVEPDKVMTAVELQWFGYRTHGPIPSA